MADNADVNAYLAKGGVNIDAAQTAWCAGFVNSSLKQVGVKGDGSLVASDFLKFGKKVKPDDVQKGDIAVLDRGKQPGQTGDHVGFATGETRIGQNGERQFQMLSGNHQDRVGYEWHPESQLQFRRATQKTDGSPLGDATTQQEQAQKALQEQTQQTNAALKTMPQSLQGVQTGTQGLDGSLGTMTKQLEQGAPAASNFNGSLESLLGSLSKAPTGGGGIFGFASGGEIKGPGTGTSDSIPAMLSHGEFVVNAGATKKHGALLEAINTGRVPHFASGGPVGGILNSPSWSQTINVSATGADKDLADQIAKKVSGVSRPPDTFRRSDSQSMAQMHRQSSMAGKRFG